jgi:hypothetical protein
MPESIGSLTRVDTMPKMLGMPVTKATMTKVKDSTAMNIMILNTTTKAMVKAMIKAIPRAIVKAMAKAMATMGESAFILRLAHD